MMEQQSPQRIDYGIIFPVLTLCIIGIVFLYSTTVVIQGESMAMTLRQLIWYGVGISLAALMLLFDSKLLWRMTPYVYWGSIALLIGAIFIYDRDLAAVAGARRWVTIPGINMTFQVTEFVKIPFILQLSRIVTKHNNDFPKRNNVSDFRLLGKIALYTVIPLLLILNQPDLGTALVFVAVAVSITLMSGIRWRILVPLFGVTLLVAILFVIMVMYNRDFLQNVLGFHEYQFRRIDTWLNPTLDTSSSSYQITQTFKAIGSGGLFGKGFGVSEVYVPVRESDMIMSTIAENFGFVGASAVIFTYFLLVYNMIKVVYDTRNEFYAYIATGVITMIVFHVFENIGMNIGLLPLTGIPLPFISQGGSALIGNMMGVGLLMSMRFNHQSYFYSGSLRGRR